MSTNKPGYNRLYFHVERQKIINALGGICAECDSIITLEIHHIDASKKRKVNGSLDRLTEWKENFDNLQVLCSDCHREFHCGKKWWER